MRILYYECKKCSTILEPNTSKKLKFCKCGKIGIDGSYASSRVVGDKKFLLCITEEKEEYIYRIKNLASGLFFNPYSWPKKAHFDAIGKFYNRKPSPKWGNSLGEGECVVEKYKIEKV
jgi:hypothetical protein